MKRAMVAVVLSVACSEGVTLPLPPPATAQMSVDSLTFVGAVGQPDPAAQSFGILSDTSWRATTSADWIRLSVDSGRGEATVEVSVRPLLLVGDVTDTIRIAAGPGVAQLPVHLHRIGRPARGLLYGIPYVDRYYGRGDSVFLASADGTAGRALRFPTSGPGPGPGYLLPLASPLGPTFSPGGDSIAFLAPNELNYSSLFVATSEGEVVGVATVDVGGSACRIQGGAGWSPDGRTVAWTCADRGGHAYLMGTGLSPVTLPVASVGTPYFSPDGTWIMVGGRLISTDRTRADTTVGTICCIIGWTPDNRIITLGPNARPCGTGVFTIPHGGGTLTRLLGPEYNYATFSPDGNKLLARRCSPSVAIELMDADGTNVTWRMPGADWAAWRP